jgi:hypothetical protein
MTDFTTDHLVRLLRMHPSGNIHSTATELLACLSDLAHENETDRKASLMEAARDLAAVLDHELNETGRGGEDYINDDVFHATSGQVEPVYQIRSGTREA